MAPEILVALITAVGGIIIAGVAAYNTSRQATRKELKSALSEQERLLNEISHIVTVNQLKVDTLWEIYAEDAIWQAKNSGLLASKSAVRPTAMLEEILSTEIQLIIKQEALDLSKYMSSPYDISLELWSEHKAHILSKSADIGISASEAWAALLALIYSVLYDEEIISEQELPRAMLS